MEGIFVGELGQRLEKQILDGRENGRTELVCSQWKDIPKWGLLMGKKDFCWKVILDGGKNPRKKKYFFC